MSDKVLILGAEGFTGRHLTDFLKSQGLKVYGTSSSISNFENRFHCDIRQKEQIKDILQTITPDYIINLAGISFVAENNANLMYEVNLTGAVNILEAIIESKLNIKKVILASSATVYGNQQSQVLYEDMRPRPVNHYGCSKYSMECMTLNFAQKIPMIITRPFNYTGKGQKEHFLIPKIVEHFKEGKKSIELGNIYVEREFNDVEDICEIYFKLMKSNYSGGVVNICSGRSVSIDNVLSILNNLYGYKIGVLVNQAFVRENETKRLVGSPDKLFSIIGSKTFFNLEKTLTDMMK